MLEQLIQLNIRKATKSKKWAEDMNRHFSKEDIQMAERHAKRCSTYLIIREIQIKITVMYHLTPIKMAIIKKYRSHILASMCRKRTLVHCW